MIATALRQVGAVGLVIGIAAAAPCAHAADASAWDGDARSAVRLIAGAADGATLRAGVEIRLAPGWKTYWRYPGDSGVPPRFDFAGSTNVQQATVQWPTPHRFADSGGQRRVAACRRREFIRKRRACRSGGARAETRKRRRECAPGSSQRSRGAR